MTNDEVRAETKRLWGELLELATQLQAIERHLPNHKKTVHSPHPGYPDRLRQILGVAWEEFGQDAFTPKVLADAVLKQCPPGTNPITIHTEVKQALSKMHKIPDNGIARIAYGTYHLTRKPIVGPLTISKLTNPQEND